MGLKDKFTQGGAAAGMPSPSAGPSPAQRFEYAVETVRSKLVGDRMEGGEVARLLNERAREGWQLRSVIETEVKGRVGPGGTMGLLVIFERPVT